MNCLYLIYPVVPTCLANEKPYIPSSIQLQEYCKSPENKKCPFYRNSMGTQKITMGTKPRSDDLVADS